MESGSSDVVVKRLTTNAKTGTTLATDAVGTSGQTTAVTTVKLTSTETAAQVTGITAGTDERPYTARGTEERPNAVPKKDERQDTARETDARPNTVQETGELTNTASESEEGPNLSPETEKRPTSTPKSEERPSMTWKPLARDIYDWSAGVSLLQLSFLLEQLLPRRHILFSQTADARARLDALLSVYNTTELKPEPTGSLNEGFSRPPIMPVSWKGHTDNYSESVLIADVDLMIIGVNKTVTKEGHVTDDCVGVIEAGDTHKGYVRVLRLHPENSEYSIPKKGTGDFYMSSTILMRVIEEGLLSRFTLDTESIQCCGPAITVNEQQKLKRNTVDSDTVFALPCLHWPDEATHWPTRHRASGWPEESLIQRVVSEGCHIVPTSHRQSTYPDAEWRYSFSVAERTLAQTLTDAQRHCYILFKTLVMHELGHCSILSSYHLKNVFLWLCERIPASEWSSETGLAATLLCLLDSLLYSVSSHCLPHYFIPDNNMLDHIHSDFLEDVARMVIRLRREPLASVLAFNAQYRFAFSLITFDLAHTLSDVISDAANHYSNDRKRYETQWPCLIGHGLAQLRERKFDDATGTFTQLSQLLQLLHGENNTVVGLMSNACLKLDVPVALAVYEYLRATFPNQQDHILGNLACMYHAMAFDSGKEHDEMLQKAEKTFLEALASDGVTAAIKMDYVTFLVHLHRYDDAIPLLKEIMDSESKNLTGRNGYGKIERQNFDDENILKEIDLHGKLDTVTAAFAYYVLTRIYCITQRLSDAEAIQSHFLVLCNETLLAGRGNASDHASAYSLLGYTYMMMQNYTEAMQAFGRAVQLDSDYTLAQENRGLCEALQLSMTVYD